MSWHTRNPLTRCRGTFLIVALIFVGTTQSTAHAKNEIPEYVKETLKRWNIEPTAESINKFFRQLHPDSAERRQVLLYVQQLGDKDYAVRHNATLSLLRTPLLPTAALAKASTSSDAEVRWRAKKILKQRGTETSALTYAVFQAVEKGRISGTVEEILRAVPHFSKHYMRLAARRALNVSSRASDIPRLKAALKDSDPQVQAAALGALTILLPKTFETELLPYLIDDGVPDVVALVAAQSFANVGNRACLPVLQRLLASKDSRVRSDAVSILREVTRQQFMFAAFESEEKRNIAIRKWTEWIARNGGKAKLRFPLPRYAWGSGYLGGNLLLAFGYQNKVVEYDPAGKEVWSYPVRGAWSAEKLPNGNVLVAAYYEKKVLEVDGARKKVVWSYDVDRALNARLLRNGNILIAVASGRKALEVTRDKQIVWQHATEGNCRDVHRLPNGNTLIASGNLVEELTPDKKRVWSFRASQPYGLQPLRNGNILIADWNGRVIEVARSKDIVWEHAISRPGDAFRLPDGNTLITTDKEFVEVTPTKQVVWQRKGCRYGTARR